MGEVLHDDGFGGGMPQQRVQPGGYPPPAAAGHVAMAGPRNQGLSSLLFQLLHAVGFAFLFLHILEF